MLLTLAVSVYAAGQPASAPIEARLEPLSNFPQTTLSILTPDARQHVFNIWLADTEAHREQGLMFVKSLEPNTGMLFIFDEPQVVTMWMKNTLISLDMVFIDKNGHVTRVIENAKPLSLEILSSKESASAVLELKGGVAKTLGIHAGALVKYSVFTASSGSK
jgi:uncharacterized membrane protein (UPF0127 family)